MTPKEQVSQFLKQLKKPYWTPYPTSRYIKDWHNKIALFNMYYVLRGRATTTKSEDLQFNVGYFRCAKAIVSIPTVCGPIGDTVVVLSPPEFWLQVVKVNPSMFTKFLPLADWERLMNERKRNSEPANINSSFLMSR